MKEITSKENTRIKRLVKLMGNRVERDASRHFVAEGLRLCMDAQNLVSEVYVTAAAIRKHPELARLFSRAQDTFLIDEDIAQKIADTKTPQGIFALCRMQEHKERIIPRENGKYVFLCSLQDPGNVGTIIRTAEALGIAGLVMSSDCPDLYSPKVLRASMGGVFRLPIAVTDDLQAEIAHFMVRDVAVFAAALDENANVAGKLVFPCTGAVLIGNEGAGLNREMIDACTGTVYIPMYGQADSLSAPIAAGILLWEMTKA